MVTVKIVVTGGCAEVAELPKGIIVEVEDTDAGATGWYAADAQGDIVEIDNRVMESPGAFVDEGGG